MKNFIILLSIALITLVYFLLAPSTDQIKALNKKVSPAVSLYPNPKSLQGKFLFIDDQRNATTLSKAAQNRWTILYFGYASCPDICPVDLAILSQTLGLMKHANRLQVVFVSVDPKRDIGNMNAFAKRFNANFIGLSAEHKMLESITKALGVYHEVAQTKQRASIDIDHSKMKHDYLIDHTASYLLLNPQLEMIGLLTNPHQAKDMATALDLIIQTLD